MAYEREVLSDVEVKEMIGELYVRGHGLADQVIEQILGNQISKEEREDLIQEGFVRLIIHVEELKKRSMGGRLSYMRSTMRNLAIDEGRKRTKQKLQGFLDMLDSEECLDLWSKELTPEEQFFRKNDHEDRNQRLEEALSQLAPRDIALLVEKYGKEKSDKEIGEKLGIRPGNVRTYVGRARKKLKKIYKKED
jgi:RNA polymerase sigma factor (sigma-70 family)